MIYEWREYRVAPGKMPALLRRFREITYKFFEKHGIRVVGYWESEVGGETDTLYYLVAWESMAQREERWRAFATDPEWIAAKAETEREGPLVVSIHNRFLRPTDFSPLP